MTKLKKMLKFFPLFVMGIIMLSSCEGKLDDLGSQFVEANQADAYDKAYALFAYNINNNDTIQADASKLDTVRLGAFKEAVFGMQKTAYITQARLSSYSPDFGKNPVVDSVVLSIKPDYYSVSDSTATVTDENYIYPVDSVAAKKVVNTYPVKKYGNAVVNGNKASFMIRVNEVTDFLGGTTEKIYSDKTVTSGEELGSKVFDGKVSSVVITKDSDASEIVNLPVALRINLNKDFFQTKILDKQGTSVLKDAATFIRYFRGLKISVDEEDGYLFAFAPNDTTLTIYYKYEDATDATVKTNATFDLNLGSGNVHLSQITYNRAGTTYENAMTTAVKIENLNDENQSITPATKIYAQGMGGSSFGIRVPVSTLSQLRDMYKTQKVGIMSAKIRLYNDADSWDNSYQKPYYYLVKEKPKDSTRFLPEMALTSLTGVSFIGTKNLTTKNAYYDISITQTLKAIVESDLDINKFADYFIQVGTYNTNPSTGAFIGQSYNSRAYQPYRIVMKGTDVDNVGNEISNSQAAQLRIIYTKK